MLNAKYQLAIGAALVITAAMTAGVAVAPATRAASPQLCHYHTARVSGGYVVQNNEWGSSAAECLTTRAGLAGFTVVRSAIARRSGGAPGGYPSIYAGCHWGLCATDGLASKPQRVAALMPGRLASHVAVTERAHPGSVYDVAYDIWVNQSPRTRGEPNGTEIMVWLGHQGKVRPAGAIVARDVTIGGRKYDVWHARGRAAGGTVTYELIRHVTALGHLDVGRLIQDTARRRYTSPRWYLVSVEAGFEIWRGGAGLAVTRFGVRVP
jgi:glycosyl hydrolase family 12